MSKRKQSVILYVKHWIEFRREYMYVRPELGKSHPHLLYKYNAYDVRKKESILLHITVRDWLTGESVPIWKLEVEFIELALDKLWIVLHKE